MVVPGLLGRDHAGVDQGLDERVIRGQLVELAVAEQVGARVAGVDDVQVVGDAVGHRQRGPHAVEGGVAPGALEQGPVGPLEALAQLVEEHPLLAAAEVEEPFERVLDERLDALDGQGVGAFAGRRAPMPSATTIR